MDGIDDVIQSIERLGVQAGPILADAINHTSNQARTALREQAQQVFDRPTNFSLNAFAVQPARAGQEPEGSVFVKDMKAGRHAPVEWLEPQEFGGDRALKDSELKLQAMGILPQGMFTVPGRGARLNQNGNMASSHIIQMLWSLRRQLGEQSRRHSDRSKEQFFVLRSAGRPIGIGQRQGRTIKVVLAFVRRPQYAARLGFGDVVSKTADTQLEINIDKAITKAIT